MSDVEKEREKHKKLSQLKHTHWWRERIQTTVSIDIPRHIQNENCVK